MAFCLPFSPCSHTRGLVRSSRLLPPFQIAIYKVLHPCDLRYGLDEAILGGGAKEDEGDPEEDAKRLASLLAHGAHGLMSTSAKEV